MSGKLKSVAVYCGHQFGNNPQFEKDARAVGEMLAKNGIRMVFGGGDVGLMGAVANAALENGGTVIGVSTDDVIARQEPAHQGIQVHVVDGVNERKQCMFEMSDAFVIMPGGIGTLNELTDIMTMQQIGETKKPLFFFDTTDFWDPLAKLIHFMWECGFIENFEDYVTNVAQSIDELKEQLLKF
ncbi:MAG: TIGR00730 family Rossman fold protein [Alphaproteobacteria bacterium]|nr:TIGR00730 family Rossman fold protein [Alphaproteobacteria bacterium]